MHQVNWAVHVPLHPLLSLPTWAHAGQGGSSGFIVHGLCRRARLAELGKVCQRACALPNLQGSAEGETRACRGKARCAAHDLTSCAVAATPPNRGGRASHLQQPSSSALRVQLRHQPLCILHRDILPLAVVVRLCRDGRGRGHAACRHGSSYDTSNGPCRGAGRRAGSKKLLLAAAPPPRTACRHAEGAAALPKCSAQRAHAAPMVAPSARLASTSRYHSGTQQFVRSSCTAHL